MNDETTSQHYKKTTARKSQKNQKQQVHAKPENLEKNTEAYRGTNKNHDFFSEKMKFVHWALLKCKWNL